MPVGLGEAEEEAAGAEYEHPDGHQPVTAEGALGDLVGGESHGQRAEHKGPHEDRSRQNLKNKTGQIMERKIGAIQGH